MIHSPIKVRFASKEDIPFIYSVWLRSYKHDSPITNNIHSDIFFKRHQTCLDRLLSDSSVTVMIACDEEDINLIFGFIALEPKKQVIHFIYVKKSMRSNGIAATLLKAQGLLNELQGWECSHLTQSLLELWGHKKTKIRYNPYALER